MHYIFTLQYWESKNDVKKLASFFQHMFFSVVKHDPDVFFWEWVYSSVFETLHVIYKHK